MEISYYFFGPSADSTILYLVIDNLVRSNLKYITLHYITFYFILSHFMSF